MTNYCRSTKQIIISEGVMKCMKILMDAGAEKIICEFTNEEFFGSYWNIEGRLKDFLRTCIIKPFHN